MDILLVEVSCCETCQIFMLEFFQAEVFEGKIALQCHIANFRADMYE